MLVIDFQINNLTLTSYVNYIKQSKVIGIVFEIISFFFVKNDQIVDIEDLSELFDDNYYASPQWI